MKMARRGQVLQNKKDTLIQQRELKKIQIERF